MARKKLVEVLDDFEPTKEEQDLDEFLQEVGATSSVVEIWRMHRDASRGYVNRFTWDELKSDPMGFIQEEIGAGRFMLIFKGEDRRFIKSKIVQVEEPRKPGMNGNGNGNSPGADPFMRDVLLAIIAAQKPPAMPDLGAMMTGCAAMMTAMMSGVPKHDPTAVFKEMMGVVQPMLKDRPAEDPSEKFLKTVQVVKQLLPDNSAPESFWGFAKDVGKEVVHRLTPAPGVPSPANGQPAATTAPMEISVDPSKTLLPNSNPAPQPQASDFENQLRIGLHYLKDKARRGKDVELFADMIFENYEEPQWNALLGAMQRGATFERLVQFDPEIGQDAILASWFKRLYDELRAELSKSVDSGGPAGDVANAPPDAGAGAGGPSPAPDSGPGAAQP
jgi:hypothetical protein